jgi:hypothetical protein
MATAKPDVAPATGAVDIDVPSANVILFPEVI